MPNLKIEIYLKSIFIVSLFSIISAYFIEYVLGHPPCNLCIIERLPYVISIILIVVNHILKKNEKIIILLLNITFIFSFIISLYHLGIEQGFFQESVICGVKNVGEILTKEELLEQLSKKAISCKDVTFRIFGLSLTTINIMLSLFLVFLLTKIYINYEKFKYQN